MHDWHEIRKRHGPLVWSTVYRVLGDYSEALDCHQDVFCEAIERTRPNEIRSWPAHLRWLATRRAIDRLRSRKRDQERAAGTTDVSAVEAAGPGPVEEAEFHEVVERVRHELAKLPDGQAEAFWLRCVEQMSYAEIGRQLGLDTSAVGVLIHRAKSRLRTMLADFAASHLED
ncbi:MAG: RNA polymerase sigma factor [Planctomycetota bacterium]|jgi:RNA polymerase sigma-70 factor (ECF subfamily)